MRITCQILPASPATNSQTSVTSAKNALNLFSPPQTQSPRGFVACVSPRRPLADFRACCCAVAYGGLNGCFFARVLRLRSPIREASDRYVPFRPARHKNGGLPTYQGRRKRPQTFQICIDRNDVAAIGRAPSRSAANLTGAPQQHHAAERPASLAARGRVRIVQWLRAVPIRWRILSIAALNSAVVVVLAVLIWNGSKVLGSAWDDVRQVRESDKILALLESETSRLQNLIHRYINQPSPELFAEILLLREAVLGTLTTRASTDPMLSGSVKDLERVTERFLNGFGELRGVQATIAKTYEQQVLGPARDMAGLYSIIEGATGHRDALIWPSLGKSREAFTAMLVAANAYYLSLATASAEDARRNTETIEKTIPVMSDLADNDLQRLALTRLHARTLALREGLAKLTEQLASRTELLRNTIDASQADAIGAIDELSVKMRQREQKAQETFDRTLASISRKVLSIAVIFLGIIISAGVIIALSIRLPLAQIMAAMRAITTGDLDRHVQGTGAKDEVGAMARAVEVFRESAIAKRETEVELRSSKEKAEGALLELNAAQ